MIRGAEMGGAGRYEGGGQGIGAARGGGTVPCEHNPGPVVFGFRLVAKDGDRSESRVTALPQIARIRPLSVGAHPESAESANPACHRTGVHTGPGRTRSSVRLSNEAPLSVVPATRLFEEAGIHPAPAWVVRRSRRFRRSRGSADHEVPAHAKVIGGSAESAGRRPSIPATEPPR